MCEEEIIKRKLLFDGDGTGDERRINLLQKLLVSWISNHNTTQLDNVVMLNKALSILRSIEYSWAKSKLIKDNYQKELELYKNFQEKTLLNTENIKETIDISKSMLQEIRQEKQFKIKFNMIAEDIAAMPSVQKTKHTANELKEVITELTEKKIKLKSDLDKLRNYFGSILISADEMEHVLNQYKG